MSKKERKAAKKAVGAGARKLSQWEIMEMSGIDAESIAEFRDTQHWLSYFPPFAVEHLKEMGWGEGSVGWGEGSVGWGEVGV